MILPSVTPTWTGPLCAFLSSVTWAIGSSAYSTLSRRFSAFGINFTRALVGLPFFIVLTFLLAGGWSAGLAAYSHLALHHLGWFMLGTFASYGFGDVLFFWSTRSLGVPGALAIASCFPIWTTAFGMIFLKQTIHTQGLVGLFVTITGVITVILNGPQTPHPEIRPESGDVVLESDADSLPSLTAPASRLENRKTGVLLAGTVSILWAVNSFAIANGGADIPNSVGNSLRMILAMSVSLFLSVIMTRKSKIFLPWSALKKSLWIFIAEPVFGSFLFMYGLANSPMIIGSTLTSLAPVLSVPVAWALGLEKVSFLRTLGVAMGVTGLWLLMSGQH
ncbi:MAG: DMT family transporter [Methylotenera sp.]|nr:DMT family transporter [Oligoflexia bacterium]